MADATTCVSTIKPLATAELKSWGVDDEYQLVDDDFTNACGLAVSHLDLDGITAATHSSYSKLLFYLALYFVFRGKIRSSGSFEQASSGDYVVTDYTEKIDDMQITEKRSYGSTSSKKGNYSLSKIDALGALADEYKKKYDDLLGDKAADGFRLGMTFYDASEN